LKERLHEIAYQAPHREVALEEVPELFGRGPARRGEREAREERPPRGARTPVRGGEPALGRDEIRTADQEVGR